MIILKEGSGGQGDRGAEAAAVAAKVASGAGPHKMSATTLVRLLAVLQNVATVLPAAHAARIGSEMMSFLAEFGVPSSLLNGMIRAAHALHVRAQGGGGRAFCTSECFCFCLSDEPFGSIPRVPQSRPQSWPQS